MFMVGIKRIIISKLNHVTLTRKFKAGSYTLEHIILVY